MRLRRPNAFSMVEILVIVGLAGLLGSLTLTQVKPATELLRYRAAMQELAGAIRIMAFRARNEQRTFVMRIDEASGMLQILAIEPEPNASARIERTLWLPDGLEIVEAPERFSAQPGLLLPSTSLVMQAPALQRTFRLMTTPQGIVRLHEDSST